jgi:DNA-binding IscR family transcriptional regulator
VEGAIYSTHSIGFQLRTAFLPCQSEETCEIRRVFAKVAESAREVLDHTTVADSLTSSVLADEPAAEAHALARL